MVVNGVEGDHKDVSEGSSAMLEVVDIAFRICALKALKMGDSPLFLDEFGKTMDSVHRRATTNLINNLMEEDSFTQMFLISHDISQYGALSNCEICVLDSQNVIVPSNTSVNKHVIFG
jgi:ABC-type nitrate/sulfonate/bicarbonate transport system ATPase subunit